MATKTVKLSPDAIEKLPNDRPVVYRITGSGKNAVYVGVAKRGRVLDRLKEHLPTGKDPIPGGTKVKIEQMESIKRAVQKETRLIERDKPRYNKQGK